PAGEKLRVLAASHQKRRLREKLREVRVAQSADHAENVAARPCHQKIEGLSDRKIGIGIETGVVAIRICRSDVAGRVAEAGTGARADRRDLNVVVEALEVQAKRLQRAG